MLNLVTALITVGVQFVTSFVLSPFIVKTLGAEANGFSQLASNFVMYASLVTLAFNSMASRFVTVAYHRGECNKAKAYYSSVYIVNVIISLICIPLSAYVVIDLDNIINIDTADVNDIKMLFACVFANYIISMISSLYSIGFYVRNKLFYNNLINCLRTICNALLLLIVFSLLPPRMFYISLVAVSLSAAILPILVKAKRKLLPDISFELSYCSIKAIKEMFLSGIWNTINQCGHLLNTGLDLLLSNIFLNPFTMGIIAVSKTIPSAIIQLASSINASFSPAITQDWAKADATALIKELKISMKLSSIIVSLPIVTFCCVGYEFYSLWQPTLDPYVLSITSFLGCMAFIPASGTQVLYNVYTAANKLSFNSITFVASGLLNVVAVFFVIKRFPNMAVYAIVGISSLISIFRQLVLMLPYAAKILSLKWYTFYKDVGISLACALINAIIAYLILNLMTGQGWLWLIAKCAIIVLLTLAAEFIIVLNPFERGAIYSIIHKKKRI